MLLFELFSIEKWTTLSNQTDIYLTSIVIGQKSTNQIAQYMVESWCGFRPLLLMLGTFRRPLGGSLQIFVLWGSWQVWMLDTPVT